MGHGPAEDAVFAVSPKLSKDRPISRAEDDVFGLSGFADALATSLLQMSPEDGLVLSVEGPWGSGKSSAIALALAAKTQLAKCSHGTISIASKLSSNTASHL